LRKVVLPALGILAVPSAVASRSNGVQTAADALGAARIKTLQFTGSGQNFSVGQNYTPAEAWPPVTVKSYTASMNYDTGSMRVELVREMGAVLPPGGGGPFFGEQRLVQVVSGNYAWNVPPAAGNAPAPPPQANPDSQLERMLALWSTPQGFVKAAMNNQATTKNASGGTEVSFTVGGKYKMTGIIDAKGMVNKVTTWFDNPIVGDMPVVTTYTGCKDFGDLMFPSRILQTQAGFPSLDINS